MRFLFLFFFPVRETLCFAKRLLYNFTQQFKVSTKNVFLLKKKSLILFQSGECDRKKKDGVIFFPIRIIVCEDSEYFVVKLVKCFCKETKQKVTTKVEQECFKL